MWLHEVTLPSLLKNPDVAQVRQTFEAAIVIVIGGSVVDVSETGCFFGGLKLSHSGWRMAVGRCLYFGG